MTTRLPSASAGLGLRRALLDDLREAPAGAFDFLECAPDNWIGVGGRLGEALHALSSRHPLTCHGLSLSLGGMAPLDDTFLARTRRFLDRHEVVRANELHSWLLGQCPQAVPVGAGRFQIGGHDALVDSEARRHMRADRVELTVVKVRIAGVQKPTVAAVDGHSCVANCVSAQRHKQDFRR